MRLLVADLAEPRSAPTDVETVLLSRAQLEFLGQVSQEMNPAMPLPFGGAHVIRTLLERIEEADLDLSAASSEAEIAAIATAALQQRKAVGRR